MENQASKTKNDLRIILSLFSLTPLGALGLLILVVLPLVPPFNEDYLIRWYIFGAIVGGSAMAFDFSGGFIGIINFGFMAFFGLGAYGSALSAIHFQLPLVFAMLFGALLSAILGFLTGVVSLRLRGIFAICLTWFIGTAMMGLAIKLNWLTRGALGLNTPVLLEGASNLPYFYILLTMVIFMYVVLARVIRSNMGLAFKAIGQNLEAAKTSGIHPAKYRIINFTLSCAFAGWLGGFYAHYYGILTPDLLATGKTVEVLAVSYIGGRGSLWGGIVAGIPFICGMEMLRSTFSNLPGLNLFIYGLFLILIMIFYPGGAAQLYRTLVERYGNSPLGRKLTY